MCKRALKLELELQWLAEQPDRIHIRVKFFFFLERKAVLLKTYDENGSVKADEWGGLIKVTIEGQTDILDYGPDCINDNEKDSFTIAGCDYEEDWKACIAYQV